MKKLAYLPIIFLVLSACSGQAASPNTSEVTPQPTNSLAEVATPQGTIVEESPAAAQAVETKTDAGTESAAPISCTSPATPSTAMTEGPYYKAGSPERASLVEENTPGTRLELVGYVLDTDCKPVAHAWLDFWQADANGAYDNTGYTLRGYQYTDENGRYQLDTVVPGQYPGRTEHIHVKIQAPDGPVVTTQLFFPNSTTNDQDAIFSPDMVIKIVDDSGSPVKAEFNFIIPKP